tara:strand:+ start:1083 stop:2279 length:1197 start_codon:yes stop_codon:yes gene_type:complete
MHFNDLTLHLESSIDNTRKSYSKDVFVDPASKKPRLKPEISAQIKQHVSLFNRIVPVKGFFIKGSILTKQYGPKADIDVYIFADIPDKENIKNKIEKLWSKVDETPAFGTNYPLQYYISDVDYDFEKTEAAYDVKNDKWIKQTEPKNIKVSNYRAELNDIFNKLDISAGELKRDVLDYAYLVEIPEKDLKGLKAELDDKLKEINYDISILLKSYKEIKTARQDAFEKDMTSQQIKKFGRKTHLPGNVIFKFLERYYYIHLIKHIKDIVGEDEKVKKSEVEDIKNLFVKKESFASLANKALSMSGGLPKTRQQTGFTGMGRLHQNLVPACHKSDPDEIIQVKQIKDGKSNNIPIMGAILQKVIKKYNVGDLTKDKPRNLGNTGIVVMWCPQRNCFILKK